jgi:hypothetical protein
MISLLLHYTELTLSRMISLLAATMSALLAWVGVATLEYLSDLLLVLQDIVVDESEAKHDYTFDHKYSRQSYEKQHVLFHEEE